MRYDYDDQTVRPAVKRAGKPSQDAARRKSETRPLPDDRPRKPRPAKPSPDRDQSYDDAPVRRPRPAASQQRRPVDFDDEPYGKPVRSREPKSDRPRTGAYAGQPRSAKSQPRAEMRPRPKSGTAPRRPRYDDDYDYRPQKRPSARRKKRGSGSTFVWSVVAIIVAFAISMVLHNYVFEVVRVSGDSMYQTLKKGDLVIVNKLDKDAPSRGELVAVSLHGKSGVIIRRIVGLPGETVSIEEGKTYIDGSQLPERYIGLETYDSFSGMTLPSGQYYVLCDNRTDLSDSRANDISLVSESEIAGRAAFRIWPLDRFGGLQ